MSNITVLTAQKYLKVTVQFGHLLLRLLPTTRVFDTLAEIVIVLKIHQMTDHLEGMCIATRGLHMHLPVSVCHYTVSMQL